MSPGPTAAGASRDLGALLRPASVAVVGASDTPGKWGHRLATSALLGEGQRPIALVNHARRWVLGRPAYASLLDVSPAPELVVLAVPAGEVGPSVKEALAVGAKAIVVITAHVDDGLSALVADARAAGSLIVGPNCAGLASPHANLSLAIGGFPPGDVAVLSQSGAMALDVAGAVAARGLGLSALLTVGEQADLTIAEAIGGLTADSTARTVLCYVEDFLDGRQFMAAAADAVGRGVHVGVVAAGRSDAGARSAQSHTGALVTDRAVVEAACRASGAVLVDGPEDLSDLAHGARSRRLHGRRFVVIGDGGGHCTVAADELVAAGASMPEVGAEVAGALRALLPDAASLTNPMDLGAAVDRVDNAYSAALDSALGTGSFDGALLVGGFGALQDPVERARETAEARRIVAVARRQERAVIVQTFAAGAPALDVLDDAGIPVFRDLGAAARTAARLARASGPRLSRRWADDLASATTETAGDIEDGYWGARRLAAGAGIALADAVRCASAEEAIAAAHRIGYPVVVKAIGAVHKSDGGGVRVGVRDDSSLLETCSGMFDRLHPASLSVEAEQPVADGVELLVGAHRDPRFGAVLLVGAGGVLAEVLVDTATILIPCTAEEVVAATAGLRVATRLRGHRGSAPVNIDAVADIAVRLGDLVARTPGLQSFELNPVLALPDRAVALDARHELIPTSTIEGA